MRRPLHLVALALGAALACDDGQRPATPGVTTPDGGMAAHDAGADAVATFDVTTDCAVHGDGVTDAAPALTQCFEDALAAAPVAVVHIPAGEYRLATPVEVAIPAGHQLSIAGTPTTVLVSAVPEPAAEPVTEETAILEIRGEEGAALFVSDLKVEHPTAPDHGNLNGIWIRGPLDDVTLRRVRVRGATVWGIKIDGARAGLVENASATENHHGGLALHDCTDITVVGGTYSNNGTPGVLGWGYGVALVSSVTAGPSRRVTVRGVVADDNLRKGLDVHHGHDVTFEGNTVRGFGVAGIYATNEGTSKDVANITIEGNFIDGRNGTGPPVGTVLYGIDVGASGAAATASGRFLVRGNTIQNLATGGGLAQVISILVRNPKAGMATDIVEIVGNTVVNGASATAASSGFVFTNNWYVPVGLMHVADNSFQAAGATFGIEVRLATHVTVAGNGIVVGTGSLPHGVFVGGTPASTYLVGNALGGDASFADPVLPSGSAPIIRRNSLRGTALASVGCETPLLPWRGDLDGDGRPDLLGRTAAGTLRLFPGAPGGTVTTSRVVGSGWNDFQHVLASPDVDGDGHADVLAITPAGQLRLYPSDGAGALGGMKGIGTGWAGFLFVIAPGDFDGDGAPDLLAVTVEDGTMYLYPGNGTGGWKPHETVGSSWNAFAALLAPGDFDSDGHPDVMAIEPAGALWLYPGDGTGGWHPRELVGSDWDTFHTVVGAGDVTADGHPDLVAQYGCDGATLYPGNGTGGFKTSVALDLDR